MKIKISPKPRGIVLAVTLGTVLILLIIIAAYVSMVNNRNTAVARSQSWNEAIPVLESGVEEALTQLHYAGTNSLLLTSNNWAYGADGLYHKSRTLPDGSYFNTSIQVASNPIIVSTGYVAIIASSSNLTRRVRVVTQPQPPTQGGLSAKNSITFNGGNAYLDSFDSSDPAHSSNGMYVAALREQNALALSDSGAAGAISLGNGKIYGSATTGPTGTVAVGPNGLLTGTTADDANVQFNDVSAPYAFGSGAPPVSGNYLGTNCTYVLSSGNYSMSSLSLSGGGEMAVSGNAVLYISGAMSITGPGMIYIAPGSSLTIFSDGTVNVAGNGIVNGAQLASQCTFYGMPGCTSISIAGNGSYIGTVDAPEASLSITGNGGAIGAFTAGSITVGGNAAVHYDQALGKNGNIYTVSSWNEF